MTEIRGGFWGGHATASLTNQVEGDWKFFVVNVHHSGFRFKNLVSNQSQINTSSVSSFLDVFSHHTPPTELRLSYQEATMDLDS